jgi:hypothetical protein
LLLSSSACQKCRRKSTAVSRANRNDKDELCEADPLGVWNLAAISSAP